MPPAARNQMRLILHAAAYWLMLTVRDAIAKTEVLTKAEFNPLRLKLSTDTSNPAQYSTSPPMILRTVTTEKNRS